VSEQIKTAFLDVADLPFFGFDQSGAIVDWNQAALETTGHAEADLAGMTFADCFESWEGETDATAVSGGSVVEGELVTATDTRVPYEFTFHRLPAETGAAVGAIGHDITYRSRQRETIETRERILREMYGIISDQALSFTAQVEALLELGREELGTKYGTLSRIEGTEYVFEVVAAADDSIQAGDVAPVSATNCEIAASTRETLVLGDVARDAPEETDRDGYTEWGIACYIGAPVVIDDEVYGTFCFYGTTPRDGQFSDWEVTLVDLMSRWVSYELQHEQAKTQLQQQNERLERFASIVSHDLRNPLGVAQMSLESARESGDEEEFATVEDAHDRIEKMIEEMLAVACAGGNIEDTESVKLEQLATEAWDVVDSEGATLENDLDWSATVDADPDLLQHVFENTFRNATDHNDRPLTVSVGMLADDDGFYIEDDGDGIPEDEREAIFEHGYTTSDEGTGIGLYIVTDIVDGHDWDITATDSSDGGARFEITTE